MKKVMATQETTKENKTYVRPTMEIYPVYVECQIGINNTRDSKIIDPGTVDGAGEGND